MGAGGLIEGVVLEVPVQSTVTSLRIFFFGQLSKQVHTAALHRLLIALALFASLFVNFPFSALCHATDPPVSCFMFHM